MKRILCYLIAIVAFVGCEMGPMSEPSEPSPDPKPVQPIKPRPIVPDGKIERPRVIDAPTIVIRVDLSTLVDTFAACSYNVCVRSEYTSEEYFAVIDAASFVDIPVTCLGEEFLVMVECDGVVKEFRLVASDL